MLPVPFTNGWIASTVEARPLASSQCGAKVRFECGNRYAPTLRQGIVVATLAPASSRSFPCLPCRAVRDPSKKQRRRPVTCPCLKLVAMVNIRARTFRTRDGTSGSQFALHSDQRAQTRLRRNMPMLFADDVARIECRPRFDDDQERHGPSVRLSVGAAALARARQDRRDGHQVSGQDDHGDRSAKGKNVSIARM